jgi:hypothetical protein
MFRFTHDSLTQLTAASRHADILKPFNAAFVTVARVTAPFCHLIVIAYMGVFL